MRTINTTDMMIPINNVAYLSLNDKERYVEIGLKQGAVVPILLKPKNDNSESLKALWEHITELVKAYDEFDEYAKYINSMK